MEVIYTIHNNPEHCKALINNKEHSYSSIRELIKEKAKEYLKKNKPIKKINSINYTDVAGGFQKSNLDKEEIEDFFLNQKESKAKSFFSSLRRKRKKGKLEKHKIDALNKLGMLWNPREDEWEKNYLTFKNNPMIGVLKEMRKKYYYVQRTELIAIKKKDNWIIEQNKLYNSGKLSEENLTRLNAINFKFNSSENHSYSASITKLIDLVLTIDELRQIGPREVAYRYNLNQKVYLGGSVKISDSIIQKIHNEEMKEYERVSKNDDKYLIQAKREEKKSQNTGLMIIEKYLPSDYFMKQIDKISRKYTPTWNDKNIYEIDKKNKKTAWGNADERLAQLYFDRYSRKYSELKNFLNNQFYLPTITIKKVKYKASYGKYNFDDEIKVYSAKKMITILDLHLLKTGHLNHKKTFKPISYLLRYYQKEKNIQELVALKELIQNHQILSLIYLERINKIIQKCTNSVRNI